MRLIDPGPTHSTGTVEFAPVGVKLCGKLFQDAIDATYSDKPAAQVREAGQNALDEYHAALREHEAGLCRAPRKPQLRLPTALNPTVMFRDFGRGMSAEFMAGDPERQWGYPYLYDSTKDGDDLEAGGFGKGRFAVFAGGDIEQVSITTDDGLSRRAYILTRSGISKPIYTRPSTERGTTVEWAVPERLWAEYDRQAHEWFEFAPFEWVGKPTPVTQWDMEGQGDGVTLLRWAYKPSVTGAIVVGGIRYGNRRVSSGNMVPSGLVLWLPVSAIRFDSGRERVDTASQEAVRAAVTMCKSLYRQQLDPTLAQIPYKLDRYIAERKMQDTFNPYGGGSGCSETIPNVQYSPWRWTGTKDVRISDLCRYRSTKINTPIFFTPATTHPRHIPKGTMVLLGVRDKAQLAEWINPADLAPVPPAPQRSGTSKNPKTWVASSVGGKLERLTVDMSKGGWLVYVDTLPTTAFVDAMLEKSAGIALHVNQMLDIAADAGLTGMVICVKRGQRVPYEAKWRELLPKLQRIGRERFKRQPEWRRRLHSGAGGPSSRAFTRLLHAQPLSHTDIYWRELLKQHIEARQARLRQRLVRFEHKYPAIERYGGSYAQHANDHLILLIARQLHEDGIGISNELKDQLKLKGWIK